MPAERVIPLTKGFFAIVDGEDFERVSAFRWHHTHDGYARRTARNVEGKRVNQWLHRFIMGEPPDMEVDHRSMNKLDCRKENLRIATPTQNRRNRNVQRNNKSGFRGVSWSEAKKKWLAKIYVDKKGIELGLFSKPEEAAAAYAAAAKIYHGDFARINSAAIPPQKTDEKLTRPLGLRNTSGHHGVTWAKKAGKWKAWMHVRGKHLAIGFFENVMDAALARKKAEQVLPSIPPETLTGGLLRSAVAQLADS